MQVRLAYSGGTAPDSHRTSLLGPFWAPKAAFFYITARWRDSRAALNCQLSMASSKGSQLRRAQVSVLVAYRRSKTGNWRTSADYADYAETILIVPIVEVTFSDRAL
jgi:hypothetical protein